MTEIITAVASVGGGLALGLLVELPIYNALTTTREKYQDVVQKMNR